MADRQLCRSIVSCLLIFYLQLGHRRATARQTATWNVQLAQMPSARSTSNQNIGMAINILPVINRKRHDTATGISPRCDAVLTRCHGMALRTVLSPPIYQGELEFA